MAFFIFLPPIFESGVLAASVMWGLSLPCVAIYYIVHDVDTLVIILRYGKQNYRDIDVRPPAVVFCYHRNLGRPRGRPFLLGGEPIG